MSTAAASSGSRRPTSLRRRIALAFAPVLLLILLVAAAQLWAIDGIRSDLAALGSSAGGADRIAGVQERTAMAAARLELLLIGGAVAAVILTATAVVGLQRLIARPVARLASAADRAAGGDLHREAVGSRVREITQLADAFNDMLESRAECEEELARALDDVQRLADHDDLCGLPNRRKFEEGLAHRANLNKRYGTATALLLLDLDGFKAVNDTLGHSAGDDLLREMGALLRHELRATDLAARLGGDEFGILLPETEPDQAAIVAEKLRASVERRGTIEIAGRRGRVTASIGLTQLDTQGLGTADDAMRAADAALYEAKQRGRNAVVSTFDGDGLSSPAATDVWIERLNGAEHHRGFELFAMPIVRLEDGEVERFEALIRFRERDGTVVPPAAFLPVAERHRLTGALDRRVVREAMEHLAGTPELRLAVNLSAETIVDPAFLQFVRELVGTRPLRPGALCLEITETAAIGAPERARVHVEELRELGCRIALDDFGSGFATFAYLRHMSFDELKIDGQFVSSVRTNRSDQLVVEAVVGLAQGLHATTVAEFVDDAACVEALRERGVDFGQGYHFGRPLPIAEAIAAAGLEQLGRQAA